MRQFIFAALFVFFGVELLHAADAADDCQCPKLTCDAVCEVQADLTFYSEKCAGGERVKSCSRPTCVPLDDAPASCKSAKNSDPNLAAKTDASTGRVPASDAPATAAKDVGQIKFVEPEAWIKTAGGNKTDAVVGASVHEKDRVITGEKGRVQIDFNNGNRLNVTSSSEVVITEVSDANPSADKKRMILDLIKGRVRNKVNVKYDGEQSFYQVKTRTAVAGVRGTEFVASVYDDDKNEVAKIETLEGKVEFSDSAHKEKVFVTKDEAATYSVDRKELAMNDAKPDYEFKGQLSQASKMSDEQLADLNRVTAFDRPSSEPTKVAKIKKTVADQDMPICSSPSATLNDCSWTCENNPKGEKKCRTDLPHVTCVRRICNANGQWSSPTRLPASYHESCKGDEPVIKSCDY